MPVVSGGPPQWMWERTDNLLKWEVVPFENPTGGTVYELRVNCGLEIMRLQFFTENELNDLHSLISQTLPSPVTPQPLAADPVGVTP